MEKKFFNAFEMMQTRAHHMQMLMDLFYIWIRCFELKCIIYKIQAYSLLEENYYLFCGI